MFLRLDAEKVGLKMQNIDAPRGAHSCWAAAGGLKHHFKLLCAAAEAHQNIRNVALSGSQWVDLWEMLLYLMVTGVNSIIVVTLSRNAERMEAMRQRMMIMGHTLPRDS